ncbi:MAG: hypothetical protein WB554_10015, partial [Desulfomonilaceae bacterium]
KITVRAGLSAGIRPKEDDALRVEFGNYPAFHLIENFFYFTIHSHPPGATQFKANLASSEQSTVVFQPQNGFGSFMPQFSALATCAAVGSGRLAFRIALIIVCYSPGVYSYCLY